MKAGHVIALIIGCLLVLPGVGLILGGGGVGLAAAVQGEDGYIDAQLDILRSDGVAVTAEDLLLVVQPDTPDWVLERLAVDTRLTISNAEGEQPLFAGIGPAADVDAYLEGAAHSEVTTIDRRTPAYRQHAGTSDIAPPTDQAFWVTSASGPGEQVMDWQVTQGRWSVVVMHADGSPGIGADVEVGVRTAFLTPLAIALLLLGLLLTAVAVTLIVVGARGDRSSPPVGHPGTAPWQQPTPTTPAASALPIDASAPATYPVSLDARLDPELSRGMWLIKWALAIPHLIILAFLWVAFVILTAIAGVAILLTGTYPRGIFDFNVGVMRWAWRVSYYATSGGIGTDRYPPFSLEDDPTYPARLDVAYPAQLSRGLVLVKWWLLAIPHYIIVGILVGGSLQWLSADGSGLRFDPTGGGGVLGVLVLIAGLALLFTGRYPQPLFDLIVGFNRWVYRVLAYAALMTDDYPPFRLDQGGTEPTPGPAMPPPQPPWAARPPGAPPHRQPLSR